MQGADMLITCDFCDCFFYRHPIIKKLSALTTTNVKLAELVTKQVKAIHILPL